jgi:hypothetical protein
MSNANKSQPKESLSAEQILLNTQLLEQKKKLENELLQREEQMQNLISYIESYSFKK